MELSAKGLEHIKQSEGLRLKVYGDPSPAEHLTIGYGHKLTDSELRTGKLFATGVEWKNGISEAEATALLLSDVEHALYGVNRYVKVPLTQGQFDALVDFTFNLGIKNFMESTLLRKLNEGRYDEVPRELRKWVNAGGRRLNGLVTRREAEIEMFTQTAACDKITEGA
jgi:lysozyme